MLFRFPSTIRAVATTVALALCIVLTSAGTAHAEGPQESCGLWKDPTYFQTSTTYGRISQRPCLLWYESDRTVMARAEFRLDWPVECPVSLDCSFRALKARQLTFDAISVKVFWNFRNQAGEQERKEGHGTYRAKLIDNEYILVSTSDYLPREPGSYSVSAQIGVDIDKDGGGWTYFPKTEETSKTF